MKRRAATTTTTTSPLLLASRRAKCTFLILPDLPSEIWDTVMAFAKKSNPQLLNLSVVSKDWRALFLRSFGFVRVDESGVWGVIDQRPPRVKRLGGNSSSLVSQFACLERLEFGWMPREFSKFSDYTSKLSNLRWLKVTDTRLEKGSLLCPEKLAHLTLESTDYKVKSPSTMLSLLPITFDDDLVEFVNLSSLTVKVSGNNFTGSCFSTLTNIASLDLHDVRCASATHFTGLAKLSKLFLNCCPCDLLNEVARLDNLAVSLTKLAVRVSKEDKEKPCCSLNALTNLTTLSFAGGTASYDNMSKLARLNSLWLTGKSLSSFFAFDPSSERGSGFGLGGLRRLRLVAVPDVDVSGLTGLTELRLSTASGIKRGSAHHLSNLLLLKCNNCTFFDDDLMALTSLRTLDLRRVESVTNESVSRLANLTSLEVFACGGITEECVVGLSKLKKCKVNELSWHPSEQRSSIVNKVLFYY